MIDYKKPETVIQELLKKFDGQDILTDLRIYGVYTGDFQEPASNFGAMGFLPVAGTSNGDVIGAAPLPGMGLEEWPVLRFDHNGGRAGLFASSLKTMAAAAMAEEIRPQYIYEDRDGILETKKDILALANIFGDTSRAMGFIRYLEDLTEESETYPRLYLYQLAEGRTWLVEFLETFHKVYVADDDAEKLWGDYTKKYPFVVPALELRSNALIKNGKDAFEPAWRAVTAEKFFSNSIFELCRATAMEFDFDASEGENYDLLFEEDPRMELCSHIAETGKGSDRPQFNAVSAEAGGEESSEEWLKAGNALLKKNKYDEASAAFVNACWNRYEESGEFYREAAEGAVKAAEGMKDPARIFIFTALTEQMEP